MKAANNMNVTVCQMNDDPVRFEQDWELLKKHVSENKSELVLLPEMPFSSWIARTDKFDINVWNKSINEHDHWINNRFREFNNNVFIMGSRPIDKDGHRYNEGFIWHKSTGYKPIHLKHYLPNEEFFYEAVWTDAAPLDFTPQAINGEVKTGMMICTDMWFNEHSRNYGKSGIDILCVPRATPAFDGRESTDEYSGVWLSGGRTAAFVAGAYGLSSNRGGNDEYGLKWEGLGWIISPDGKILAQTDDDNPFATITIDLEYSREAKNDYPRYVGCQLLVTYLFCFKPNT